MNGEKALRIRVGGADVMLGQLDRLLAVMSLPRVSLGIIPAGGGWRCLAQGSFWVFDEERIQTEGVSAGLDVTQSREVAVHLRAFALLQASATYGADGRKLVTATMDDVAGT
ncbi:Scr1 family TA system antitoxin-like transcriptional regulator [Longispora sp. NPDC051575]|uniref:Scr1 family TA system antitoxin-like transcriptional regulator n=1 Tax=Longispora sp. NPDC051575 TaxID=3154943 RepID=UPI00341B6798